MRRDCLVPCGRYDDVGKEYVAVKVYAVDTAAWYYRGFVPDGAPLVVGYIVVVYGDGVGIQDVPIVGNTAGCEYWHIYLDLRLCIRMV